MPIPENLSDLAKLFHKLGASDPEDWACSQIEEQIPQLHRYLFLRQAWKRILKDGETGWIDAYISQALAYPDEPYSGIGLALKECLDAGADRESLSTIVRATQAEMLFSFCYLLGDPALEEPEVSDLSWALFSVDDEDRPLEQIGGLHESVLETDPTGREMRPPSAGE